MTPERFKALAQTYGARLARWPASELEAGKILLAADPSLDSFLTEDAGLDDALDAWDISLTQRLADLILATSPCERRGTSTGWTSWLSGAGVVGALGVGALAGAALVLAGPLNVHSDGLGSLYDQTSFGDLGQTEPSAYASLGG